MKFKLILASICFASVNAMAQYNEGRSQMTSGGGSSSGSKGVTVGLVYSNLSDASIKQTSDDFYYNGTKVSGDDRTEKGGIHAGLMGLNMGYKNLYAFGAFGFDASAQILRGLNGSETPSKLTVYKILSNAVLPLGDMFAISGGLNISYFSGYGDDDLTVEPGAGVQAGAELRVSQMSLLVGGHVMTQTFKGKNKFYTNNNQYTINSKIEVAYSGVITQLSYTF